MTSSQTGIDDPTIHSMKCKTGKLLQGTNCDAKVGEWPKKNICIVVWHFEELNTEWSLILNFDKMSGPFSIKKTNASLDLKA